MLFPCIEYSTGCCPCSINPLELLDDDIDIIVGNGDQKLWSSLSNNPMQLPFSHTHFTCCLLHGNMSCAGSNSFGKFDVIFTSQMGLVLLQFNLAYPCDFMLI